MIKKGLFITFEGPEGSGKTTHSKLLVEFLRTNKYNVLYTREPGGTSVSEKIRKILLDPRNKDMDVVCEMLLYMAARAQIIREKILPALKKGYIVVCDRFIDATVAYQGYAGGLEVNIIKNIGGLVTKGISPELTFLLDIDAKKGLLRAGRNKDRIEKRSLMYHNKVRKGYLSIVRKESRRMKIITALGNISETQEKIRNIVLRKLCRLKIS